MSFNVLYGGPFPGFLGDDALADSTVKVRLQILIDEIVSMRPDVAVLQEVSTTRPDRHCSVLKALLGSVNEALHPAGISYNAAYGRASSDPSGLTELWESGEVVLSRFEILEADVYRFKRQGSLGLENRIALRATLRGASQNLDVVGVHLHPEGGETAEAQVDELLDRVIPGRGSGNPVILAGDFNLEPDSRAIRRLLGLGWKDAWADAGEGGPGYTFGHRDLEDRHAVATQRIDYIFVLRAAVKESWLALDEAVDVDPGVPEHWLWPSDHSAVWARIEP